MYFISLYLLLKNIFPLLKLSLIFSDRNGNYIGSTNFFVKFSNLKFRCILAILDLFRVYRRTDCWIELNRSFAGSRTRVKRVERTKEKEIKIRNHAGNKYAKKEFNITYKNNRCK